MLPYLSVCGCTKCCILLATCTCRLVLVTLLPRILTRRGKAEGSPSYLASLISDYVPSRSLKSSDKLLLSRPYTSLVMADKAVSVCAPKIWNDLSLTVVLQLVSIVLNAVLNVNSFTPHVR